MAREPSTVTERFEVVKNDGKRAVDGHGAV
jgi:hypothetical protein